MAIRVPIPAHEEADDNAEGTEATTAVAFEDLWQHRAALRDLCQRIVGDAATADDVVQETYLRALRNLDRLEQRPSLMPWLATVARRRSIDELRRRQYQRPVEIMPDDSTKPEHDPGEAAGVSETVERVREALTALTDRERELLMQQVNQGLSLAQLAEMDESSVASVRSVLSRARTKLRDALADTGARALAPLGLAGAWFKRTAERLGDLSNRVEANVKHKVGEVNVRVQRVSPVMPGGYERVAEVATAAAVAGAMAIGGILPAIGADGGNAVVEVAGSAVADVHDAAGGEVSPATPGAGATGFHKAGADSDGAAPKGGTAGRSGSSGASGGSSVPVGPVPEAPTAPDSPTPPPGPNAPGSPVPEPEEEPAAPEDAIIEDITYPGEGFAEPGSQDPSVFALGRYAGTCPDSGCNVLYRSDDGGETWTSLEASGLDANSIMVAPGWPADERIYAMGAAGLQVSHDGGHTFSTALSSAYSGPAAMTPTFATDESIFIGSAPYWDYEAGDAIPSAGAVTGLAGDTAHFAFTPNYGDSGLLFAGSTATGPDGLLKPGVWTCNDGACSEPEFFDEISDEPEVFVSSAYEEDKLVLAWRGEYLYLSDGPSLDFELVDNLPIDGPIKAVSDDGEGAVYVAIGPAGTSQPAGIARSTDGGETWTLLGTGTPLATDRATVTAIPAGPVFAAPKGSAGSRGLYCSTDGGDTWQRRCTG